MALARPRPGAHAGRLVPCRRLPDALPGQVAHLARRPARPRHPRGPHGVRRRRHRRSPTPSTAYRKADRLDPFGFSGWIGREPHGAGEVRQRDASATASSPSRWSSCSASWPSRATTAPWLAVASFVNPHDIAFAGWAVGAAPRVRAARRHRARDRRGAVAVATRSPAARACQRAVHDALAADARTSSPPTTRTGASTTTCTSWSTRRSGASSTRSTTSGMADDTIVVFTSDHGDLLGAHGGLQQKWYNAYDEAIRVPMLVSGPRRRRRRAAAITSRPATST